LNLNLLVRIQLQVLVCNIKKERGDKSNIVIHYVRDNEVKCTSKRKEKKRKEKKRKEKKRKEKKRKEKKRKESIMNQIRGN
jgi:hypothetical protein